MAHRKYTLRAQRKAKAYQLPTRFSLRLAVLRSHQVGDEARPPNDVPTTDEVIDLVSDSELEKVPEYIPGEGHMEEEEEEVPEYIPGDGAATEKEEEPEEDPKRILRRIPKRILKKNLRRILRRIWSRSLKKRRWKQRPNKAKMTMMSL
ncbi:hypothetical protein PIB30_009013 [Stylosanthes scabra]|uniref:Uncharacterized protein n=1 Tax=Stylosanthes scabra TaxID=79078 RepID=A0ABU6T600_9FABA|nr:hypothetical protein [Stylosanthes scabra]